MLPSEDLGEYVFSRDTTDLNRLNLQHYLWRDIFGYLLHPSLPQADKNVCVADIGAGTGAFLLDLQSVLGQDARLDGLDFDISQAPPRPWIPSGITFRQWDVFEDLPDDLVGVYDIVHVRLFICVVRDNDPRPILQKLMKMLKPGGYLQWSEADLKSARFISADPSISHQSLESMYRRTETLDPRFVSSWVETLSQTFTSEGLQDVIEDWKDGSKHTAYNMHLCNLSIFEMFATKAGEHGNPKKMEEILAMLNEVFKETRRGAMLTYRRVCVVGRKPLQ